MIRSIVAVVVLLIMGAFSAALARRRRDLPLLRRLINALFPLSQMCVVAFLFYYAIVDDLPLWVFSVTVAAGLACCPVDAVLFKALHEAEEKDLVKERVRLLEEQLAAQEGYRRRLESDMVEAHRIRSDLVAELEHIDECLERQETMQASEGLQRAVDLMGSSSYCYCEHRAVDALVTMKAKACEEAGVRATVLLDVPEDVPLSSVELCAVFSNLLDNALHACERLPEAERFVDLRSSVQGAYLVVDMRNSCMREDAVGARAKRGGRAGRGLAEHGWGLQIVQGVAERHGGTLLAERDGGEFRTTVMLGIA